VPQTRAHPSQQMLFDLLGTHCPPPSPVFFKFMLFFSFIPVWNTSSGMGGFSPSNSTVINLCAISFLFNHDPDLRISPRHCRRLAPLQKGLRAIQSQARRLCDQAPSGPPPPPTQPPAALGLRHRRCRLPRPRRRPRRRWGFDACAAAPPAPGAAPNGTGASTPAQPPPPPPAQPPAAPGLRRRRKTLHLCSRTTRVVLSSFSPERGDDDQASTP
jgi:hypothetical protein